MLLPSLLPPTTSAEVAYHKAGHGLIGCSDLLLAFAVCGWFFAESAFFVGIFVDFLFHVIVETALILFD
jgi:hypothetical protein